MGVIAATHGVQRRAEGGVVDDKAAEHGGSAAEGVI